jgi:hypothetical protein
VTVKQFSSLLLTEPGLTWERWKSSDVSFVTILYSSNVNLTNVFHPIRMHMCTLHIQSRPLHNNPR